MSDTFRKNYNPSQEVKNTADEIKTIAEQLEEKIKSMPSSRESSLAMTNLEQSIMWAIKALYMSMD